MKTLCNFLLDVASCLAEQAYPSHQREQAKLRWLQVDPFRRLDRTTDLAVEPQDRIGERSSRDIGVDDPIVGHDHRAFA
ncbi:hypothetical protein [Sphingomonas faeni]|uniref:hypothetical protein n=1 Tax=Sphingomonas faeni TaxID=185950 RepID=UPI003364E597